MAGKREKKRQKREWSKIFPLIVVLLGFVIAQECLVLMVLCVIRGYTATAAWLTAAVGLAEAVIGLGLNSYMSLAKSDHKEGGITFEAAKANGFIQDTTTGTGSENSPGI